ncbi:MAG: ATP-binding cassette domain-containing protein [Planctomycetota bacterium]|nr:ATP-binding cassette domain-containing protein [Planctomycetota bacterium]
MLRLTDVRKSYDGGRSHAVDGVSLEVGRGELVVLLGESGCGKTTTLKMVNRLIEPSAGRIEVDGRDVTALDPVDLRRRIGYVFQGVGLFPHMTVAENVAITPTLLGWDPDRIQARVTQLLELLGLDAGTYADRMPHELSGGQQQRVGFARALAAEPGAVLLDEPFGALDPSTRDHLQRELQRIQGELGFAALFVTHDMTEALLLATRIVVMQAGRVVQTGTPAELLQAPADDYVAALVETPKRQAARLAGLQDEATNEDMP